MTSIRRLARSLAKAAPAQQGPLPQAEAEEEAPPAQHGPLPQAEHEEEALPAKEPLPEAAVDAPVESPPAESSKKKAPSFLDGRPKVHIAPLLADLDWSKWQFQAPFTWKRGECHIVRVLDGEEPPDFQLIKKEDLGQVWNLAEPIAFDYNATSTKKKSLLLRMPDELLDKMIDMERPCMDRIGEHFGEQFPDLPKIWKTCVRKKEEGGRALRVKVDIERCAYYDINGKPSVVPVKWKSLNAVPILQLGGVWIRSSTENMDGDAGLMLEMNSAMLGSFRPAVKRKYGFQ